jgi:taurine dioxygenase
LNRVPYSRTGDGVFEVRPVTPAIGAEIHGLDVARPCHADTLAALEDAWLRHKVLFFRDQRHATTDEHVAFCRQLGPLETHPFAPSKPGYPEVMTVIANQYRRGNENTWHSDVTWREEPSRGSMLRAIQVPPVGGDTLFADMEAAFDGLDAELQERCAGLRAVHDLTSVAASIAGPEAARALGARYPPVEHPVIRTHPTTGRRSIYVNAAFTTHVVGLPRAESDELLQHLYRQAVIPEYQCRLRWEPGTVALWDNRCVQHYATSDYWPAERVMERVTIAGDRPR